jgi:peroxiredoxin
MPTLRYHTQSTGKWLPQMRLVSPTMSSSEDHHHLAGELVGQAIPSIKLHTTRLDLVDLLNYASRCTAIYVYPGSAASVDGEQDTPLADAAQHQAFRERRDDLFRHGVLVAGLSSQSQDEQLATAETHSVLHWLLSDPELSLARALGLPTCKANGETVFARTILIVRRGEVAEAVHPVDTPENSAEQVLAWAKANGQ